MVTFVGDPSDPYYEQVAVLSGSKTGGNCRSSGAFPDIYTRLDDKLVLDWINAILNDWRYIIASHQLTLRRSRLTCALSKVFESNFTTALGTSVNPGSFCQCRDHLWPSHSPRNCNESVSVNVIELWKMWTKQDNFFSRKVMDQCENSIVLDPEKVFDNKWTLGNDRSICKESRR